MDDDVALLHEIVERILDAKLDVIPWFDRYVGDLRAPEELHTYVRHKVDLLGFARIDPTGKTILDAGSGFGFTLLVLAHLGAARALGIETFTGMVDATRAWLPLVPEGLRGRIAVDEGSVLDMPYDEGTFDAVISNEAISHYQDVDRATREIHRVLKPGGTLVIADGNNGLNPATRRRTRELWDAFERGTPERVVHGHPVELCYQDLREDYVAEHHPGVPAREMARETCWMTFDQVAESCATYLREGSLPGSVWDGSEAPRHPADGQALERLFDPYALARDLRALGFDVRVTGYWGGARGQAPVRMANAVLTRFSRLTIFSARGFRIAARRL